MGLLSGIMMALDSKARKQSTLGFVIAAVLVFAQRFILLGEISDSFSDTDFFRWLLATLALPMLFVTLALIANINLEFSDHDDKMSGILESLGTAIFLVLVSGFLYTISGITILYAAAIISIYPVVLVIAAIYSIANRKS